MGLLAVVAMEVMGPHHLLLVLLLLTLEAAPVVRLDHLELLALGVQEAAETLAQQEAITPVPMAQQILVVAVVVRGM